MYRVVLTTVYNGLDGVLYEGDKYSCKEVLKAFEQYNNAKNIEVLTEDPTFLTDQTRDRACEELARLELDHSFGDGQEEDMVWHGCSRTGLNDLTDKDILDQLEQVMDDDDEVLVKVRQEWEEFKLLRTEG